MINRSEAANRHRWLPYFGSLILLAIAALIGLLWWVGPEGYFFPYPAIDTRFAPDYSETQFQQIEPGMFKAKVLAKLGLPLNQTDEQGWVYSEDNAFPFWDFAWLVRGIGFDENGKVIHIVAYVAYD